MTEDFGQLEIRMTEAERSLFQAHLSNKEFYLEYGCGGSTKLAIESECKYIVSVESDMAWIERLKKDPDVQKRVSHGNLIFEYVDIGPVKEWGFPKDESKIRNWVQYAIAPFKFNFEYDFILVDGRFRKACALAAYAHMLERTVLAIHDYTVRHDYYEVEKFFEVVDVADTLVIFRRKSNIIMPSFYRSVINGLFEP